MASVASLVAKPICFGSARPARAQRTQTVVVRAASDKTVAQDVVKTAAFASMAGTFLAAGNAHAATEIANIAAGGDSRASFLLFPIAIAAGIAGLNILGPAQNQIKAMSDKKSVAAGLGLGAASLLMAGQADAATEAMQLAAGDSRASFLLFPIVIAAGIAGLNILGPLQNQLKNMSDKKSVAAGLGLGGLATLMAAGSADAAAEIANIAAGDSRGSILLFPVTIAAGVALLNILGPAQNQIKAMSDKKSVAAGLGLGAASLLMAGHADAAATEAMQLAAGDGRAGMLFLPLGAALAWVLFNIAEAAKNQINNMSK